MKPLDFFENELKEMTDLCFFSETISQAAVHWVLEHYMGNSPES